MRQYNAERRKWPGVQDSINKACVKHQRKYKDDPVKKKAWRVKDILRWAVESGKIKRGPCEACGKDKTAGHHEDYDYPLDVIWLCREHHVGVHMIK